MVADSKECNITSPESVYDSVKIALKEIESAQNGKEIVMWHNSHKYKDKTSFCGDWYYRHLEKNLRGLFPGGFIICQNAVIFVQLLTYILTSYIYEVNMCEGLYCWKGYGNSRIHGEKQMYRTHCRIKIRGIKVDCTYSQSNIETFYIEVAWASHLSIKFYQTPVKTDSYRCFFI